MYPQIEVLDFNIRNGQIFRHWQHIKHPKLFWTELQSCKLTLQWSEIRRKMTIFEWSWQLNIQAYYHTVIHWRVGLLFFVEHFYFPTKLVFYKAAQCMCFSSRRFSFFPCEKGLKTLLIIHVQAAAITTM